MIRYAFKLTSVCPLKFLKVNIKRISVFVVDNIIVVRNVVRCKFNAVYPNIIVIIEFIFRLGGSETGLTLSHFITFHLGTETCSLCLFLLLLFFAWKETFYLPSANRPLRELLPLYITHYQCQKHISKLCFRLLKHKMTNAHHT